MHLADDYTVRDYGSMISSSARTGPFVEALRRAVRPDSVVVDIGSGTGIFALLACRFGAARVYAIEASDGPGVRPALRRRTDTRAARPGPGIDDAVLHLGAPGCYVLERRGPDGEETITGSDGERGWAVSARGAVRTSRNPARFRGALPGEQHDLPFVDPSEGFAQLRKSYDIALGRDGSHDGRTTRTIVAHRRPDVPRGPKDVTIEYDAETARVVRMTFDRLPQANGGPRTVTLELVGEHPLEAGFFGHESHHDRDRKVIAED